mmetsp:Transcript_13523/g.43255  ORF Transcript_13523/g.43255 Transcript_13523/m.43255 type:complete len:311 (-) Transcript_13523:590-1522(-)
MSDIGFGTSWLASRAGSDRAADRNRLDGLRDSDGRHSCDGVDLGVDGGGSHRRHGRHAAGRCGGVEHRARRLCRHRDRHGADDRAAAASHAPAPARGRHRAGHFLRSERRARRLQVLRRLHAGALAAARAAAEAQHQAAGGEGEQLVAEADAKDGRRVRPLEKSAQAADRLLALRWVSGTVGDEESVERLAAEVVVPRHEQQLDALGHEVADDVRLDAAVDGKDAHALAVLALPRRRVRDEEARLFERNLGDEVEVVRVDLRHRRLGGARGHNLAEHGALLADVLGEGARVDAVDARHVVLLEPVGERVG